MIDHRELVILDKTSGIMEPGLLKQSILNLCSYCVSHKL